MQVSLNIQNDMNKKLPTFKADHRLITQNKATKPERFYNMVAYREVQGQNPYYAILRDIANKIIGIQEGRYILFEKNGKLIEKTESDTGPKFYEYYAVNNAETGKVECLMDDNGSYDILVLTADKNGDIVSSKIGRFDIKF